MRRILPLGALVGVMATGAAASAQQDLAALTAAAHRGDGRAEFSLGMKYHGGEGLPQDYGKAFCWVHRSAEHGNIMGWISLGMSYRMGQGVARDDIESYKWFYLADRQYPPGAPEEFRRDAQEDLASVAKSMSADQIAAAKQRADDWLAAALARGGSAIGPDPVDAPDCDRP